MSMTMPGLIERLAAIPYTGAISDILEEMGLTDQVLPHEIQALDAGRIVAGRALTVLGEPAPHLARDDYYIPYLGMLGSIAPGDVIVSQPNDSTVSHFGELSAETAKLRGGAGIVVDGGVRDIDYIVKMGFPAFARYTTPRDIVGRWRLVDANVPVTIGRTRIQPGDYVLGDRDGVLIIPAQVAAEVVSKAEHVIHTENHLRNAILGGMPPLEAYQKFGRF